jgi:hypothetical protein
MSSYHRFILTTLYLCYFSSVAYARASLERKTRISRLELLVMIPTLLVMIPTLLVMIPTLLAMIPTLLVMIPTLLTLPVIFIIIHFFSARFLCQR